MTNGLSNGKPHEYDGIRDGHRLSVHMQYEPGGLFPRGTAIIRIDPDECILRAADVRAGRLVCGRSDHPTATSDCHRA